jgi:hypothetical protein
VSHRVHVKSTLSGKPRADGKATAPCVDGKATVPCVDGKATVPEGSLYFTYEVTTQSSHSPSAGREV